MHSTTKGLFLIFPEIRAIPISLLAFRRSQVLGGEKIWDFEGEIVVRLRCCLLRLCEILVGFWSVALNRINWVRYSILFSFGANFRNFFFCDIWNVSTSISTFFWPLNRVFLWTTECSGRGLIFVAVWYCYLLRAVIGEFFWYLLLLVRNRVDLCCRSMRLCFDRRSLSW